MRTASQVQIKRLAKLQQKKFRREFQRFLLSGLNTVHSALQSEYIRPQALYITEAAKKWLKKVAPDAALPVYQITEKEAVKISEETHPQGIILEADLPVFANPRFEASSKSIYLDQVNDPGNLGTIIRTALRFGFRQLLLSPRSADPFQPKVVRASTGYVTHLRIYEDVSTKKLQQWRRKEPLYIVGTAVQDGSALADFQPPSAKALVLVFGSEAHGIDETLRELCDQLITIPGESVVESLNLAVSAGIILNHIYTEERKDGDVR